MHLDIAEDMIRITFHTCHRLIERAIHPARRAAELRQHQHQMRAVRMHRLHRRALLAQPLNHRGSRTHARAILAGLKEERHIRPKFDRQLPQIVIAQTQFEQLAHRQQHRRGVRRPPAKPAADGDSLVELHLHRQRPPHLALEQQVRPHREIVAHGPVDRRALLRRFFVPQDGIARQPIILEASHQQLVGKVDRDHPRSDRVHPVEFGVVVDRRRHRQREVHLRVRHAPHKPSPTLLCLFSHAPIISRPSRPSRGSAGQRSAGVPPEFHPDA